MNILNKNTNKKSLQILTGLLLGFAIVAMIPISDTLAAKPKFDNSTLGKGCSSAWDIVIKLRAKRAAQGGELSLKDSRDLNNAEANYNSVCAGIYGSLPRDIPFESDIPTGDAAQDKPQSGNSGSNGGIIVGDMNWAETEQQQAQSGNTVPNQGIYVEDLKFTETDQDEKTNSQEGFTAELNSTQ